MIKKFYLIFVIIGAMLLTKAMCGDMPFSEIMTTPITYDSRQCSVEKETPQNFVGPRSSSTHSMSKNKPIPMSLLNVFHVIVIAIICSVLVMSSDGSLNTTFNLSVNGLIVSPPGKPLITML